MYFVVRAPRAFASSQIHPTHSPRRPFFFFPTCFTLKPSPNGYTARFLLELSPFPFEAVDRAQLPIDTMATFNAISLSHTLVHYFPPLIPVVLSSLCSVIPAIPSFVLYPRLQSEPYTAFPLYTSDSQVTNAPHVSCFSRLRVCHAAQQIPIAYDSSQNVTPITGTWLSGSMDVVTSAVRLFFCLFYREPKILTFFQQ